MLRTHIKLSLIHVLSQSLAKEGYKPLVNIQSQRYLKQILCVWMRAYLLTRIVETYHQIPQLYCFVYKSIVYLPWQVSSGAQVTWRSQWQSVWRTLSLVTDDHGWEVASVTAGCYVFDVDVWGRCLKRDRLSCAWGYCHTVCCDPYLEHTNWCYQCSYYH